MRLNRSLLDQLFELIEDAPVKLLWKGDPVWLAPISAVKYDDKGIPGVIVLELVLGEYSFKVSKEAANDELVR